MNELADVVAKAWGWTGIKPVAVTAVSPFGHLVVRDAQHAFWYLDPEVGSLTRVATDDAGLAGHMADPDVKEVWDAEVLVEMAQGMVGETGAGRCYALKMPAMLGGEYVADNLTTLPLTELIGFTGDLARQNQGVPDGAHVGIKIVD